MNVVARGHHTAAASRLVLAVDNLQQMLIISVRAYSLVSVTIIPSCRCRLQDFTPKGGETSTRRCIILKDALAADEQFIMLSQKN
jgi:hypothetical protein